MRNTIAIVASVLVSFNAVAADLATTFKKIDGQRKGAFALNTLQGTRGREVVGRGNPGGSFLFQAAFRNDIGRELATQHDMYVANLFTTNYYELMGEYVYNNPYGSFELNHNGLLAAGDKAMPKATSMVRNWVLEKYYLTAFPSSKMAQAFQLRGISGAEFEQQYAVYFLNFYLTSMNDDFQFLPAFMLAKGSSIANSASLDKARNLIAAMYDYWNTYYPGNSGVKRLYQVRNAIHNQLSESVIGMIDRLLREYPNFKSDGRITEVQSILKSYYNVSAKRVADFSKKAGANLIFAAAEAIDKGGFTPARGLALSKAIADYRTVISDETVVASAYKTNILLSMQMASQYLNKEIGNLKEVSTNDVIVSIINLVYAEGFLIKDNWEYFAGEVAAAPTVQAAAAMLPDIVEIANDTLAQAMSPAYDKWVQVQPKMSLFMDNAIKSSALNTASLITKKIK